MSQPREEKLLLTTGEDNDEQVAKELGQIFSTRNPKDAVAGISSGLKSIGKGVVGGVASLVALPIHGAKEEGVVGFAKGLGLGVLSAAAMTVAGVGVGVTQIGRGIVNTPASIHGKLSHQVWDEEKRVWYYYDLKKDYELLLEEEKLAKEQAIAENANVVDKELYDVIGVAPTATAAEIKKAYRTAAIKQHPDKNLDDPNANEKFQKLGEAYQVLSNPQLRAQYDSKGKDGIDKGALLDSANLFEMIFGSQRFDAYVGELSLMAMQDSLKMSEGGDDIQFEGMARAEKQMKARQRKREVLCAINLAKILDQYLEDASEEHVNFATYLRGEAKELVSTAFGGTLIGVLGYVYEEQAYQFLGFKKSVTAGLGINNLSQSAHIFASKYKVLTSAVKMYQVAKEEEKKAKDAASATSPEKAAAAAQPNPKAVGSLMETLWNYTVVDVEGTLRVVCTKILKDSSVPYEVRIKRAEGLLMMGQIFQQFGQSAESGLSELEKQMMMRGGASSPEPQV
ncbi:hypothetical protein HDV03_003351 [Kappamyces sp. JEL0829]|nr:hypothetical protein HDV03_003351 [Kappamyces sp. JEL0829]